MHYLAILGRQPELGITELESLLGDKAVSPFGNQAAVINQSLDINRLGGTQKIGRVLYQGPARDINEAPIPLDQLPVASGGKTTFGLSYYGLRASSKFVLAAGLTLKKRLRGQGSIRLVTPQTGTSLTAAQVKFNGLTRQGFELLVVAHHNRMVVAITEQFQDIDWYAARDYQRPTRSAKVGMLPPKLAQIMVNTTTAPLVYDPFCGTGVVLQEALLLGRAAGGSDISPQMVAATEQNLTWLRQQRPDLPSASAHEADARNVQLPDEPIALVSEGYLGPNMSRQPSAAEAKPLQSQLSKLYADSLQAWGHQIPVGTEVTLTLPMWHTKTGWQGLDIIDRLPDLGYTLRSFAHCDSRKLLYRRPNQVVGRQLLILRKS